MDELELPTGPFDWLEAFAQNPDQPWPGDPDFDVPPELMTHG